MEGPGVPQVFAVPNVKRLRVLLCYASNLPGKYDACGEMPRADTRQHMHVWNVMLPYSPFALSSRSALPDAMRCDAMRTSGCSIC